MIHPSDDRVALRRIAAGALLCSTRALFEHARPSLPAILRQESLLTAIADASAPLPPAAAAGAFECRLDIEPGVVGYEACIRVHDGGRDVLARAMSDGRAAAWPELWRFVAAWSDPASVLHHVPAVWVEFDVDGTAVAPPFAILRMPDDGLDRAVSENVTHAAVANLGHSPLATPTRATLDRCLARIRSSGRLLHVARRPLGDTDVVRLIILERWREATTWLADVGWTGSIAALDDWLARSCVDLVATTINLDIAAEIGPRVGVEYHFPSPAGSDPRWQRLLDLLEHEGLCTPQWRRTICDWMEVPQANEPRPLWPPRVERSALIKIVHDGEGVLHAKAYLAFQPCVSFC